jgi:hypothetical protein
MNKIQSQTEGRLMTSEHMNPMNGTQPTITGPATIRLVWVHDGSREPANLGIDQTIVLRDGESFDLDDARFEAEENAMRQIVDFDRYSLLIFAEGQ